VYRRNGVYRSDLLDRLPWVDHGFGSRESEHWPGKYTQVKQIHSNIVVVAGDAIETGDALITRQPGRYLGVRTADCVPLLIADRQKRAVAAVHAGWRGTVANIARAVVQRFKSEFDSEPEDLVAAVGPSIARCCFEVGPEVAAQFGDSTNHIDLVEVNCRQLVEAGVDAGSIDVSGLCTVCTPGEFHSWRRDRVAAGRMVAAIAIRCTDR
jgi:polyphenol oxidase